MSHENILLQKVRIWVFFLFLLFIFAKGYSVKYTVVYKKGQIM